eukprot:TRINITY_DN69617_c0_g1_i1.p1 TRINITY_DN69617_c0_g1~~TRINITY_DN69617_c0_g1_i1.p1  ORF type:complete len:136 (-),score=29.60 TRINITY_DN69617_c0_g1_i1:65-472(-)
MEARNPLQNFFGQPRLIAIVKESLDNDDGSNEVEAFREYFPGDVYLDSDVNFYKGLGSRSFTDGAFSQESQEFFKQRIEGVQAKKVDGNFKGGAENSLLAGGSYVVDRSGSVRFAHQEGVGAIDYEAVRQALVEM